YLSHTRLVVDGKGNPFGCETINGHAQILLEQIAVRVCRAIRVEQRFGRRTGAETGRARPGKQFGNKIRTVGREFNECLVEEVFNHVLAADIDDKGDSRLQSRNVSEVLLRADSQINATGHYGPFQRWNDFLKTRFIGQEIIGAKITVRFRKIR